MSPGIFADRFWKNAGNTRPVIVMNFIRVALLCSCLCGAPAVFAQSEFLGVSRIVAIGDVHGDYDSFVEVLREAELINRRRNWIAGDTHLVQVGDLPDRGPDTDRVIELLRKLEKQAADAGGRVHALIGNHEAMNMLGDLRYVHPGEYSAFRSGQSRQYRNRYYEQTVLSRQANDPDFEPDSAFRKSFEEQFPLGYVEHRFAWAPEGEIGSWVLSHNAAIKIDRYLFLHGGLSPALLGSSLEDINSQIRDELAGKHAGEIMLAEAQDGPLWYRGLAQNPETEEAAHVDAVLEFYEVDHIILGHTPGTGVILPRFDGKVLIVDTGMSSYYGSHGASLLIENDQLTALQQGERVRIPEGRSPLEYLQRLSDLKPDAPAALGRLIDDLAKSN
jgi:hypothetical protein